MMKVCPVFKDAIDNTYELTKLVKISPKLDAKLHSIQVENNSSVSNKDGEFADGLKNSTIKLFCHTRWTVCADCVKRVIRNFDELQKLWDWSLENCSCSEMKARIRGIKVYIHSHFLTASAYIQLTWFFLIPTNSFKHCRVLRWQQSMLRLFPVLVLLLSNQFGLKMNSNYFGTK